MRRTLIAAIALELAACATTNTARQDLAYARWASCRAPYTQLERVDVDGRITFLSSDSSTREAILRCLTQASQAGPPLPEPIAIRPSGGP